LSMCRPKVTERKNKLVSRFTRTPIVGARRLAESFRMEGKHNPPFSREQRTPDYSNYFLALYLAM
jgi:hypothetical protein